MGAGLPYANIVSAAAVAQPGDSILCHDPVLPGGIFLQNLLYSLHFYMIAAVPLNWSKHFKDDIKLENILGLPKSEKVIALVAIGYPVDNFKVPISRRKNIDEIFKIINNK